MAMVVLTARSQTITVTSLDRLAVPRPLGFVAARREATALTANVISRSQAQIWGLATSDHVSAIAGHLALIDRPVRANVYDRVQEGESVVQLRQRWRLRESDLARLNPDVDLDQVEPGTQLCVWHQDTANTSRSCYRANRGRLQNGELMPPGEGWIIRNERLAYAVDQTIDGLIHAMRVVMSKHPEGQELLVADLSSRNGGRLRPHLSHQSGRDADVTYFRLADDQPSFSHVRVSELDLPRTWTFIRTLLVNHEIEYMFMSRAIQEALYRYAESIGEHPAFLDQVFQYGPRGHRNSRAPIRFARGHGDHIHIRFACGEDDLYCR